MKYIVIVLVLLAFRSVNAQEQPLISYVRPLVGTSGYGNIYPGSQIPFGGIQISPDTDFDYYDAAAGYKYDHTTLLGFSLTHLSGTGIPDLGDFLFMPGGVGYRAEYTDTEIVYFYFLTAERFPEPEVFTPPSPAFFRTLCLDGASCWDLSVPGYKLRTASALMGILAIRFLQESFRDPEVNISAACRHGGISEGYFRRIFRQRFGISPIAYLTSLRADLGRKLLAEGATVESAAAACGICDPKYFSRVLKKVYGCTPSRMKNNTD